jgi:hypothetical protein
MTFCGNSRKSQFSFKYNGEVLEQVSSFQYLGLTVSSNGKFNVGVKSLKDQGRRAMMALLKKSRNLDLPISTQLELFDTLVRPILTYGCEIWGYSNIDIVESVQLEFLKYVLHLKKSTPSIFVYGETGKFPLYVHIYKTMVKFWHKLMIDQSSKYSCNILHTLVDCYKYDIHKNVWLVKVKQILDECGLSFVWNAPNLVSTSWLDNMLSQNLKDTFIQKWSSDCKASTKASNYVVFKANFQFETYLDTLPSKYRIAFSKFRTCNHKLPVERGRYTDLPRHERCCNICNSNIVGDEYHFLLECETLHNLRLKFLPRCFHTKPNFSKFSSLMSCTSKKKLLALSKFVFEGLKLF